MNGEVVTLILGILGVIMSLAVRSIPSLANWFYTKLTADMRFVTLAGVLAVITAVLYPLSCYSPWVVVACEPQSVWTLLGAWVAGVVSSQVAYLAKSPPDAELEARALSRTVPE